MTKNVDRVSLKKSKRTTEGLPNLPLPEQLVEGELAINYAKDVETISLKNESGDVVTFSSDNYYTERKLGSGFTGENSAKTVTDYITELEGENLWEAGTGLHSAVLKGTSGVASGDYAVVEGYQTSALTNSSHAEGQGTLANGWVSHAEGYETKTNGQFSHAEGQRTIAGKDGYMYGNCHAEGCLTEAIGDTSHAEGQGTKAYGQYSHAEGDSTEAYGRASHAEGESTGAYGRASHTEGLETEASGYSSHAEGYQTDANGSYSHAEGYSTKASGESSHAEGQSTKASGDYSHAEGNYTSAMTEASHAEGKFTKTTNKYEHASGSYNNSVSASTTFGDSGNTLFSVGNGTAENARHNAFEIRQNGDIYIVRSGNTVLLQDEIGNIVIDQVIDSGTSASTNAVSTKAVYDYVTAYTPSITVDLVLDGTTSASTNPVASKAVYERFAENEETWALALNQLNNDKVGYAEYDSESQTIYFYKDSDEATAATPTVIASIDASAFVKDGFLSGVTLENREISGETKPCLVFEWNTDAGIQETVIPIGDAFSPTNYYTKSEVDARDLWVSGTGVNSIVQKGTSGVASGDYSVVEGSNTITNNQSEHASGQYNVSSSASTEFGHSGNTLFSVGNGTSSARHNAFEIRQNGDIYIVRSGSTVLLQDEIGNITIDQVMNSGTSASTNAVSTKAVYDYVTENELVVSGALNDLEERKLDASAYTPTDLSNYYTKSETSGATDISTALNDKASETEFTAHTADSTSHLTSTEKSQLHTHSNKTYLDSITGTVGTMAYENASSYSSATEVSTALSGKSDTGHTHDDRYYTETEIDILVGSGFTSSSITDVIIENEQIVSSSLNDLYNKKLDASAYTPTDLSDYYTKSETSGKTELSTKFNEYYTKAEVDIRDLWVSGTGENAVILKGSSGTASGDYSVAEGYSYEYDGNTYTSTASGSYSHTEGSGTEASGDWGSHAEGDLTIASGDYSHAEGSGTEANGVSSHAEGSGTNASGDSSHAEGESTIASGDYSHAEGSSTIADGYYSHAEGHETLASGASSHAEGHATLASGGYGSHAEGNSTSATSNSSHAEGSGTKANGASSHAEGLGGISNGNMSHVEGYNTTANNDSEHASGQYNVSSSASTEFGNSGNTLFSVGNGTSTSARHNAFEIRQNGDIYIVNKAGNDVKLQSALNDLEASAHTHTNKTTLDEITASSAAINSLTGTVGTMAFENASSYSSATEVSTALSGLVSTATTVSGGTGLSGGGNLGSDVTLSLTMPSVHTAATYTATAFTSNEPIVYCVVTASGDLNNQTCPVTLAEGQQCIVIYKTAAARTISFGTTGIITPDGSGISITTKDNGYCEVNYIKLNGDIFLRGV